MSYRWAPRFRRAHESQGRVLIEYSRNQELTFDLATHPNFVKACLDDAAEKGESPGPNGVSFAMLNISQQWRIARDLSRLIRKGTYRPGPVRASSVPKSHGKGSRILSIPNIFDRVANVVLNNALSPCWERVFLPRSYGFRRMRSSLTMLAGIEREMLRTGAYHLAIDDIRDAFDHVNIESLVQEHRAWVQDTRMLHFAVSVLSGSSEPRRKEGITQGGAYSPTALNVRLHHLHDLPLEQDVHPPQWFRYADNIVYLGQSVLEGKRILDRAETLLRRGGMSLKRDQKPTDVRKEKVTLLGFKISLGEDRLTFEVANSSWKELDQHLEKAHHSANPERQAEASILGWINAFAPALEDREETITRIRQLMHRKAIGESYSTAIMEMDVADAIDRWNRTRKTISGSDLF